MKKHILPIFALIITRYVSSSPDEPDFMEPYRCRVPDEWCSWINYGWDERGPQIQCVVEEGWGCGGRVTTTVTVTVTGYSSMPILSCSSPPVEVKVTLEAHQDLSPTEAVPGPFPIPQPDGRFRSDPIYRNTTRPLLGTISSYKDIGQFPTTTTVTVEPEQVTPTESPIFPGVTQPPGFRHEPDVVGTDLKDQGPPEGKTVEVEGPTRTHISSSTTSAQLDPLMTIIFPTKSHAKNRLHDPMPFTTAKYLEGPGTRPSFPGIEDKPMAILEVSCITRSRLFYSDFKITWGPSWDDQAGCKRLHKAMNRRGITTGWKCRQVADPETGYIMEASGHRPMSPRYLVEGAIREAFSGNTLYYRGYKTAMLCERPER